MASKGQSFTPQKIIRQPVKGQPFKPTKIPRPPQVAKQMQRAYATAPVVGKPVAQSAPVPFRPAAPAPPPSLAAQPLPLDPAYELQRSQALAQFQQTQANTQYQRGQVKQEYGFLDVSNPYNRATTLQRSWEQRQHQNLNNMASSGQLYSGATQAVQDEGTYEYGRQYDAMRREHDSLLQQLDQAEAEAKAGYQSTSSLAALERVQRALENRSLPTPPVVAAPVRGQAFTPTRTARPKGLAKRMQQQYKVVKGL